MTTIVSELGHFCSRRQPTVTLAVATGVLDDDVLLTELMALLLLFRLVRLSLQFRGSQGRLGPLEELAFAKVFQVDILFVLEVVRSVGRTGLG